MDKQVKAEASPLFEKAWAEFCTTGNCNVVCDQCGGALKFWPLNESVWQHACSCGRFSGTLSGVFPRVPLKP